MNKNISAPRKSAFTLLEIMIVVCIISLLAVIAIPNFVRARTRSVQTTCLNNLRQIRSSVAQWALENNASLSQSVQFTNIQSFLRGEVICPAGGTSFNDSYLLTDVQTPPTCKKMPTGPDAHILAPDVTQ